MPRIQRAVLDLKKERKSSCSMASSSQDMNTKITENPTKTPSISISFRINNAANPPCVSVVIYILADTYT
eukprot:CCRYP_006491-RA/>CCRYP_006491-RA protein AED:0.00 eAED:0.00 QI:61/1/1/1/0/0/2/0/69